MIIAGPKGKPVFLCYFYDENFRKLDGVLHILRFIFPDSESW